MLEKFELKAELQEKYLPVGNGWCCYLQDYSSEARGLSESGIINKYERSGCDRKDDVSEELRSRKNSY